ncbi:MAG: hypothetical protein ABH868_01800 [bacterium]
MFGFLSERHEIVYNIMLIIVCTIIAFLVNWIRSIYKSLEQKGISVDSKEVTGIIKQLDAKTENIQSTVNELSKQAKELNKKYGDCATHVVSVEKALDNERKKIAAVEQSIDEKIKNIPAPSGSGEAINKRAISDTKALKDRLEGVLDKFKVHDDQLVNLQKIVSKSRDDIDSLKSTDGKAPGEELEKVYETISEDKNLIANLNERADDMQGRITEQSEQIEILQRIFEDIDADLVEIDKYFKSLPKDKKG